MSRYLQVAVQYVTVSTDRGAVCHGHYCTGCGAVLYVTVSTSTGTVSHGLYRYWCSMSRFLQVVVQYVTVCKGYSKSRFLRLRKDF